MQTIKYILVAIMLMGCNLGSNDTEQPTTYQCYEGTGDYLATGRTWEPTGYVSDAFYVYRDDDGLQLWTTPDYNEDDVQGWLDSGYRVAIQYISGPGTEHAEPLFDVSQARGKQITWIYVAGEFDRKEMVHE